MAISSQAGRLFAGLGAALLLAGAGFGLVAAGQEAAEPKGVKEPPKVVTDNKNTLVKTHRAKLVVSASSFWPGWEPEKVIDDNMETSWFSQRGDAAAKGTKPWVTLTFPEKRRDFEFKPKQPVGKVRSVKFTSLKDQGDQNPYDDIAIAEFMIE